MTRSDQPLGLVPRTVWSVSRPVETLACLERVCSELDRYRGLWLDQVTVGLPKEMDQRVLHILDRDPVWLGIKQATELLRAAASVVVDEWEQEKEQHRASRDGTG